MNYEVAVPSRGRELHFCVGSIGGSFKEESSSDVVTTCRGSISFVSYAPLQVRIHIYLVAPKDYDAICPEI